MPERGATGWASSAVASSAGVSGSGSSATPASRNRIAASVETGSQTPSASRSSARSRSTCRAGPSIMTWPSASSTTTRSTMSTAASRLCSTSTMAWSRSLAELAQHGVDLVDAGGVEVGRGLVEHEHRGGHRQGAGDGEALPPAARQPVGVLVAPLPQAHELEGALGAGQHLVDRHQLVLGAERHLVEQGAGDHLGVGVLEDHRHVRAEHAHAVVAGVEPRDAHRALEFGGHGMRHEPVERERERRLAAPRRAEQQHDLARRDRQRHAVRRRPRRTLVADAHAVEVEQRGIGQGWPGSGLADDPRRGIRVLGQPNLTAASAAGRRDEARLGDRAIVPGGREFPGQLRCCTMCPGVEPPRRKEEHVGISYVEFEDEAGITRRYRKHVNGRGLVATTAKVDPTAFVDPKAYVDPGAEVQRAAQIGPGAWIESDAIVAERAVIGVNAHVGRRAVVGRNRRRGSVCDPRRRRARAERRARAPRDQDRRGRGIPRVDEGPSSPGSRRLTPRSDERMPRA